MLRSISLVSLAFVLALGRLFDPYPRRWWRRVDTQSQDGGSPDSGGGRRFVTHAIRVDTVGYLPARAKLATVVMPKGAASLTDMTAEVRAVSDDSLVWPGDVTGPQPDPDTGVTYYVADFTHFAAEGDYYLASPGLLIGGVPARSAPLKISANVFGGLLSTAMLSFYGQRCGTALEIKIDSTTWKHAECHTEGRLPEVPAAPSTRTASSPVCVVGMTPATTASTSPTAPSPSAALQAWERFQPALSALSLPIAEHGGALPDFLAEVKWELDWLLTTQARRRRGQLQGHGADVRSFRGGRGGQRSPVLRGRQRQRRGQLHRGMAQASRIFAPYDASWPTRTSMSRGRVTRSSAPRRSRTRAPSRPSRPATTTSRPRHGQPALGRRGAVGDDGRGPVPGRLRDAGREGPVTDIFDWDNLGNMGVFTYLTATRGGARPSWWRR